MTNPYRTLEELAARIETTEKKIDTHAKLIGKLWHRSESLWQRVEALELAQLKICSGPKSPLGELVAEQLPSLRRRLESVVKTSRCYDGYSTMTPVELADRIIDAVLVWIPFITSSSGSNFDD